MSGGDWRGDPLKVYGYEEEPYGPAPVVMDLHKVQREEVQWLWDGRLALGRLTCLTGDPGVGKSWLTLAVATAITTGAPLPGQTTTREPAKALMLTAEDGLADTVRPRAEDMGADIERIKVLTGVRDAEGREHHPSIVDDLLMVEEVLAKGGFSLLIIDPIAAYLGSTLDTHRDAALRSVLGPLATLAERWKVAVIFTLHLTKSRRDRAIYRGQGSIAYSGAARVVLLAGQNPEDPQDRALAWVKGNLTEAMPSLGYEIREGRFYWRGDSDLTAEQMLTTDEGTGSRKAAEEFLLDVLSKGPLDAETVREQARDLGVSDATLRRAKKALEVESIRQGGVGSAGYWTWTLPAKASKALKDIPEHLSHLSNGSKRSLVDKALNLGLKEVVP